MPFEGSGFTGSRVIALNHLSRLESVLEFVDAASEGTATTRGTANCVDIDDRLSADAEDEVEKLGKREDRRSLLPFGRIDSFRSRCAVDSPPPASLTSNANASNDTALLTRWFEREATGARVSLVEGAGGGNVLCSVCASDASSLSADRGVSDLRCVKVEAAGVWRAAGFGGRGGEERSWRSSCSDLKHESSTCHWSAEHLLSPTYIA